MYETVGILRLYDGFRQEMGELHITRQNDSQGYLLISTYAMFALYAHNASNPVVPPGSPIRYTPGGILNYLATIAGNTDPNMSWILEGEYLTDTGNRQHMQIMLPSSKMSSEYGTSTVTALALLLRLPENDVRTSLRNHLTFRIDDDDQ